MNLFLNLQLQVGDLSERKTLDDRIHPYLLLLASKRGGRHAHSLVLTGYSHHMHTIFTPLMA
jgi:hypothetical protein